MKRIDDYIATWEARGYADGIPDEVPDVLMRGLLAPSYRAIALAILRNDLQFLSLGFAGKESRWYGELKRIELAIRDASKPTQQRLCT